MDKKEQEDTRQPAIQIQYSDEDELKTSELQNAWTETMAGGTYRRPNSYKKVSVLILTWAEVHNNLKGVQDEVNRLSGVFENSFNYSVTSKTINCSLPGSPPPRLHVNAIVAQFVLENDGPNHLLIVYYAGHGKPGDAHGSLVIFGKPDSSTEMNEVVWNHTESNLRAAQSHILLIFDCCHAGDLTYKRGPPRAFEYLAATKAGEPTRVPGPKSFTSALIRALHALLEEKGTFTSVDLAEKIKKDPGLPEEQSPVLSDREANSLVGRVTLHPMPKSDIDPTISIHPPSQDPPLPGQHGQVWTLHLDLAERPTKEVIIAVGKEFNNSHAIAALGVERIRWGGMRRSPFSQAFSAFNAVRHRRSRPEPMDTETLELIQENKTWSLDTAKSLPSPASSFFPSPDSGYLSYHEEATPSANPSQPRAAVASKSGTRSTSTRKRARTLSKDKLR